MVKNQIGFTYMQNQLNLNTPPLKKELILSAKHHFNCLLNLLNKKSHHNRMASINYLKSKNYFTYITDFTSSTILLTLGINSSTKLGAYASGTSALQTRFTGASI